MGEKGCYVYTYVYHYQNVTYLRFETRHIRIDMTYLPAFCSLFSGTFPPKWLKPFFFSAPPRRGRSGFNQQRNSAPLARATSVEAGGVVVVVVGVHSLSSCAEAFVEPHAGSGAWGNSGRCICVSMRSILMIYRRAIEMACTKMT